MSAPNKLTQMNAPVIFDIPRLVEDARHQRLDPGSDTIRAKLRARERDPNTVFVMSTASKGAINERRTSRPEEL